MGFKPALNSKGLRRVHARKLRSSIGLQASPEFKGIKTDVGAQTQTNVAGFKPALNSKGLRLQFFARFDKFGASSQP